MARRKAQKAKRQLPNQTLFTGDNLDVMRGINSESVDLIYMDPPFNSNRDFAAPIGSPAAGAAFRDTWKPSDVKEEWIGIIAESNDPLAGLLRSAGAVAGRRTQAYLTYMSIRLLEMDRILRDGGTLLAHCDDRMDGWLDAVLTAIFGQNAGMNKIVWQRTRGRSDGNRFGRVHDTILYFVKGNREKRAWNSVYLPGGEEALSVTRTRVDEHGEWRSDNLTAPSHGYTGPYTEPWSGVEPPPGRQWNIPTLLPEFAEALKPEDFETRGVSAKLDWLQKVGLIHWTQNKRPRLKRYVETFAGVRVTDVITHISPLRAGQKERIGYPTQKPRALLEMLIKATTNEGDLVLDPFCGCATTLIAAEDTGREWWGVDISSAAVELVKRRFLTELPLLSLKLNHQEQPPQRTDRVMAKPSSQKPALYGEQKGNCKGCGTHFEYRQLTIDHITPKAKGGSDHISNLQLLCYPCNALKGTDDMATLKARLRKARTG